MPRTQQQHQQQQPTQSRRRQSSSAEISYGGGGVGGGGATTVTARTDQTDGSTGNKSTTLLVVIVSLVFVAIFAGALVGGVVSGDPSNVFFLTIIVASAIAVTVAIGVAMWYCRKNRRLRRDQQDGAYLSAKDPRATFSNSEDDEDRHHQIHRVSSSANKAHHAHAANRQQQRYHPSQDRRQIHTPVEARIQEIQADGSVAGLSALSPQTYGDIESLSTRRTENNSANIQDRAGLFDFSSVGSSARNGSDRRKTLDPPEGAGPATYHAAWLLRGTSQDPAAPKALADGSFVEGDDNETEEGTSDDVELNSIQSGINSIPSPQSVRSRYDVGEDDEKEEENQATSENIVSNLRLKENMEEDASSHKTEKTVSTTLTDKKESKEKKTTADFEEIPVKRQSSRRNRQRRRSRSRSRSRSKSPAKAKKSSHTKKEERKYERAPSSTKSGLSSSLLTSNRSDVITTSQSEVNAGYIGDSTDAIASSVPSTPAASDTGSVASSIFKKIGIFAGGKRKVVSEVGFSNTSSFIRDGGNSSDKLQKVNNTSMPNHSLPPKAPGGGGKDKESAVKRQQRSGSGLSTINGGAGAPPSTPGGKSTYSIPPPRRVPSTPGGASVAFSEYRSMVGSTANSNAVASSTFDPAAHQRALQKMQMRDAALGASQVNNDGMPIYYEDEDKASSVASYMPSRGAYDVFAPPGAIGIVVDTTEKGCIVHSLKKSSPMQGLINPGDLIVALDDFDVRKMTAASLTKLMAKKSKQAERKFTLEPTGDLP